MSVSTNSLVAKAKRIAVPVGAFAALLLAATLLFNHTLAHAAGGAAIGSAAPMDESSVSSLVALDNAVEAVAARVTPAVVNVSVTSRASAGEGDQDGQASGIPQNALPPGFQFFFGPPGPWPGSGQAMNGPRKSSTALAAASSSRLTATSSPTITSSMAPRRSASRSTTGASFRQS